MKVVFSNCLIERMTDQHVRLVVPNEISRKTEILNLVAGCSWFDPAIKLEEGMMVDVIVDSYNWTGYKVIPTEHKTYQGGNAPNCTENVLVCKCGFQGYQSQWKEHRQSANNTGYWSKHFICPACNSSFDITFHPNSSDGK